VITFKKPQEFARMAVAGRVVAAAHAAVRESIRPGVSMEQLDLIADRVIRDGNCIPSFLGYRGYPAAICASPNDVIVHGIPGDYRLREGDLISIDVGAIYEGFHGDAAFSAIVGSATAEVVKLNAVTEEAMWAGVAAVRHGARVGDVAHAVEVVGRREGYGIVEGYGSGGRCTRNRTFPTWAIPGGATSSRRGWPSVSSPCSIWAWPGRGSIRTDGRCGPSMARSPRTGSTRWRSPPMGWW
jgi:methionyl aminopeptidase